jgi:predicted ATPase
MPGKRRTSVVEEEERKKIDLRIEVEDFGPISGGEITLKPLTVFIGPNNSGKSYAAMLIHSIFESYTPPALFRVIPFSIGRRFEISPEGFPELKRQVDHLLKGGGQLDIPRQYIEVVTNKILEEVYQKRLDSQIIRLFACPLDELIRIGKSSFALKVGYGSCSVHLTYQEDQLRIREYPKEYPQLNIKLKAQAIGEHQYELKYEVEIEGRSTGAATVWTKDEKSVFPELIGLISDMSADKVLENVAMQCHYLPAARSGILQLYKPAVRNIVREATAFARPQIPRLSGAASDLILYLIDLPERKGPFYQLARDFERELMRGEIIVPTPGEHLYPEIKYSFQGTEIPLHRSSSTVSELAPLFLYLKYIINPNSILMIEEPEAHLHPGNQRILARLLVRLVREGVNMIITTHSEYLLDQLSNFIMFSKVEPERRVRKYKYSKEDFLKPDEIAAYVFRYDKESAGHRVDEVEITEEDGISDEEFARIYEALYEETIKLRRDLSDET